MVDYERHGVYHVGTRGGHEASIVVIDDGRGYVEGFRCDVRDLPPEAPKHAPVEWHNARVIVADEAVTIDTDAVDLTTYHGRITDDRDFETVEFPDVDEDPDTRYASLADAYGYDPDVGDRNGGSNE
jgi:hypothetical protein